MRIRAKHFWIVAIAGAVGAVLLLYAAWRKPAPISLRIATATRGVVVSTALAKATESDREKLRALAALYRDVIQVGVRSGLDIQSLGNLRNGDGEERLLTVSA